jgi:hypothetical protein
MIQANISSSLVDLLADNYFHTPKRRSRLSNSARVSVFIFRHAAAAARQAGRH